MNTFTTLMLMIFLTLVVANDKEIGLSSDFVEGDIASIIRSLHSRDELLKQRESEIFHALELLNQHREAQMKRDDEMMKRDQELRKADEELKKRVREISLALDSLTEHNNDLSNVIKNHKEQLNQINQQHGHPQTSTAERECFTTFNGEFIITCPTVVKSDLSVKNGNLFVLNGQNRFDSVNGKGNVIIGRRSQTIDPMKMGSHNLILGPANNYTSYGGFVMGQNNYLSGPQSFIGGGAFNTASGFFSSVATGFNNTASGAYSSITAGTNNIASGNFSAVAGGENNDASAYGSFVSSGKGNRASKRNSSVLGGKENTASAYYSSVTGGQHNKASGNYTSVTGGSSNQASGSHSSVTGGIDNKASGQFSSVTGGADNQASGAVSSITGGVANEASGLRSSVSGGLANEAIGLDSSITGGVFG